MYARASTQRLAFSLVSCLLALSVGCSSDDNSDDNGGDSGSGAGAGGALGFDAGLQDAAGAAPDSSGPQDDGVSEDGGAGSGGGGPQDDGVSEDGGGPVDGGPGTADGGEAEDTAGGSACDFPADPQPGEPGASCKENADCDSLLCVDTGDGKVCSIECIDCCPGGFACVGVGDVDVIYACIPKFADLCRPCSTDAACTGFDDDARCVSYGPQAGSFCGLSCKADTDCPGGYVCQLAPGVAGTSKQCVREDGVCACNKSATADQAATACSVTNAAGTCSGERVCVEGGLSACSAATPLAETCNGLDDNCDGQTDEGVDDVPCEVTNEFGTCTGIQTCVLADDGSGGEAVCDAATPEQEVCDGIDNNCDGQTDEGMPDSDNDGILDCFDTDGDNDGVDDDKDCEPDNPNVFPGNTEACNFIDDDCDNETDEEDAKGCQVLFADEDEDGAAGDKSKCLCGPSKPYIAFSATDCDDNNKLVGPAVPESCNNIDDNCDGKTDIEDSLGCTAYYKDADGDGFGTLLESKCLCAPAGDFDVDNSKDCCDLDGLVKPGQDGWFSAKNICGDFDYNCDNQQEKELTELAVPGWKFDWFNTECSAEKQGWDGSVPTCGTTTSWITDYNWNGVPNPINPKSTCTEKVTESKTQRCR